jgi:flagellar hook protein FlgE
MALIGTLTSGVSALNAFSKDLEVIGNNIANVNTTGYKSSNVSFADSFSNTLRGSSPSNGTTSDTSAVQVGTGVNLAGVNQSFTQGDLAQTSVASNLAVSGNGFFTVINPTDGTKYVTRDGDFRIDDQGYLVNSSGYRVQGFTGGTSSTAPSTYGDIKLGTPPTGYELQSYSFDTSGNLTEFYSDGSSVTTNQVSLTQYKDPSALVKEGDNLYTGFDAAGPVGTNPPSTTTNQPNTNGLGKIQGGSLEQSNVDLTDQFAQMISTERSFQAASRVITVSDEVLQEIVNLKH